VAEIPEEDWAEVEIIGWLYHLSVAVLHHPRRANARGASPARFAHPDPRA
jgi:hypothetical protein